MSGESRLPGALPNSSTRCMGCAFAYQALVFADTLPFALQASEWSIPDRLNCVWPHV